MANIHLARYLTSLIIREVCIEYSFIVIRITSIQKADNTKGLPKFELCYISGVMCNMVITWENCYVLYKINIYFLVISLNDICPMEMKTYSYKMVYTSMQIDL